MEDGPKWSNIDGYGNIIMYSLEECGKLNDNIKPWNRIPALEKPYSTPVNTTYAWSPSPLAPISYKNNKMFYKSCNICNNYPKNSPCNNC